MPRRAAFIVSALLVLSTLLVLPVAGRQLTQLPTLAAIASTATLCFWSLAAYLIFSQAVVVRSRPLVILATACFTRALLGVPYLLTYPGIFSEHGLFGSTQSAAWLWAFGQITFALIVAVYAFSERRSGGPWRRGVARRYAAGGVAIALLLTILVAIPGLLPSIVSEGDFAAANHSGASFRLALLCAAALIYTAIATRGRTVLDLWLIVTLLATTLEVVLGAAGGVRYTAAWYLSRFDHVLASLMVLTVFLFDFTTTSRKLATLAAHDVVSGLANRRALDERLEIYVGNRRRRGDALSVIMLDIDHFKAFNDRHGHAAGDACLRAVADILRGSLVRSTDFVARYGGEEFVVMLPATDRLGAIIVAERIRGDVERLTLPAVKTTPVVTVSLGVVTVPPHKATTVEKVLRAVDRAMYAAKAAGRNCIVEGESTSALAPSSTASA